MFLFYNEALHTLPLTLPDKHFIIKYPQGIFFISFLFKINVFPICYMV